MSDITPDALRALGAAREDPDKAVSWELRDARRKGLFAAADRIEALTAERDEGLRNAEAWLCSMVEPTVHSDAEFARWAIQRCYDRLALVLSRTEKEPDNGEPRTYLGSFDCWPPRQEAEG